VTVNYLGIQPTIAVNSAFHPSGVGILSGTGLQAWLGLRRGAFTRGKWQQRVISHKSWLTCHQEPYTPKLTFSALTAGRMACSEVERSNAHQR